MSDSYNDILYEMD